MITLKTIAEKAGVSVAAVSATLNEKTGKIGVSAETRGIIQKVANELGYQPNQLAASLRTGRTYNLGVCIQRAEEYLAHPQGAYNFWKICEIAGRLKYRVSIINSSNLLSGQCTIDGCLVIGLNTGELQQSLTLLAENIPVININGGIAIPGAINVTRDNSLAMFRRQSAEYLYKLGHRYIAVVSARARSNNPGAQDEITSIFKTTAAENNIKADIIDFYEENLNRDYKTIKSICKLTPMPTAVFTIDDDYAKALINNLLYKGIKVPQDISVFSGSLSAVNCNHVPALTGLAIHHEKRLEEMVTSLINIIESNEQKQNVVFKPIRAEIIECDSCKAIG